MPPFPSASRDLVFSNLPSSDIVAAVVQRIRSAIGLGLVAGGDKLPKEAELARQFGISAFALREALTTLREEGAIETRAGKFGGSFVTESLVTESLAHDELCRLTFSELRDLGDWRRMLSAQAADLAARRASPSNLERLSGYAHQVSEAQTAEQARRAHGRFYLELAAAGQSMRLSQAGFAMHDQLDWLFGLVLDDEPKRALRSAELSEIVHCVGTQNSDYARVLASTHILTMVDELARLRLELIASRDRQSGARVKAVSGESFAAEVELFVGSLASEIGALAVKTAPLLGATLSAREIRTGVSLLVLPAFDRIPIFSLGLGVMAEVGVVPEHPYWINWWETTPSGPVENTHHILDPEDENFYDYEAREFIAQPRQRLADWATGPYVDYGGNNDYIVTFSSPILFEDRFLGVVTVDLLVADLERHFSSFLAGLDSSCVVVNAENRVVMSNSVSFDVGDVVRPASSDDVFSIGVFGWSLVLKNTRVSTETANILA
ncbi:GntR family transcriptional regulator [Subtercola lobariae]|uniref:HTH gntR-type domain-containing protein n=1 Tax=Subtercola lobariae TaxID=1588641 RepID=A0A917BCC3_9MICO|nr:GntR family transcriptional regulator [Subtercola lobariae]GGF33863.1 hypothetical protein GCM10011399_28800 [Subtercola lobariae]